ncbi:MAG: hypothetical protein HY849_08810 [Nitrosomonadales bacterium]|nr:hypothetical protein [Nitrosomonadales bacterium]
MVGIVEHFKKGTFEEKYWLPAHNKRRESALFRKNKKLLRDDFGAPCWICGATTDLEVHHVFEWAFWNALDPRKVTDILHAIEFYDEDYTARAKEVERLRLHLAALAKSKPIIDSPDDARNLVVLCREHHRLGLTGIHTVSFPLWLAIAAVPITNAVLTRSQLLAAVARVSAIDQELAALAANNYQPHRI